jgi:hypothetical protein
MLLCALQSVFDKFVYPTEYRRAEPQFSINLTDLSFNLLFKRFYVRYGRREIAVRQSTVLLFYPFQLSGRLSLPWVSLGQYQGVSDPLPSPPLSQF